MPTGLAITAKDGIVDLANSNDGTYTVTYTTGGLCSKDSTVQLKISNNPSVFKTLDQSVCEETSFNPINFAGSPGSSFQWNNDNTDIGLASIGTGNIPSFIGTGTNATGSNLIGMVIVTPFAGSCTGIKDTFLLEVKAKDNATFTYPNNTFCTT